MGSRRRPGSVRHLEWRVRIFGAGAILAVVGMATGMEWLINLAIAVLAVGVLLRFVGRADEPPETEDE